MHALYLVIQPAPSFADRPSTRAGWRYWLKFLRALGDRRNESLLLAVSQLDKVVGGPLEAPVEKGLALEFKRLIAQVITLIILKTLLSLLTLITLLSLLTLITF
jgi:hypothetical protein